MFIVLPSRPARAAIAGLGLYTPLRFHQGFAVVATRLLVRAGLGRMLSVRAPQLPPWWEHWVDTVAQPVIGRPAATAFLLPGGGRICALLLQEDGRPKGFVKFREVSGATHEQVEPAVLDTFGEQPPCSFRTPRMLAEGTYEGFHYRLLEPLPEGPHRRPPVDPSHIAAVVDEVQDRLAATLPRPANTPKHYRPSHGDLTPRNVRVASDGHWWVFDWEYARWAPPLADELRYWAAEFAFRPRRQPARDGRRIAHLLQARGSDADIVEALRWPEFNQPSEQAMRDAVGRYLRHVDRLEGRTR